MFLYPKGPNTSLGVLGWFLGVKPLEVLGPSGVVIFRKRKAGFLEITCLFLWFLPKIFFCDFFVCKGKKCCCGFVLSCLPFWGESLGGGLGVESCQQVIFLVSCVFC